MDYWTRKKILVLRLFHLMGALVLLFSTFGIYYSIFSGYKGEIIYLGLSLILIEGIFILGNRGVCPLTNAHKLLGDDNALFDFILPERNKKYGLPVLIVFAAAGILIWLIK